MALSGIHPNKMVVPWFNVDEWKLVKGLIFSDTSTVNDYQKALRILKNWKRRTPILPCGVEGTLIVLNVLLVPNIDKETYNVVQGQAIMRFLNVCVAGRSKQGDFHKTIKQMGLPAWLINLRHDVAHGSVTPSTEMLDLGLHECLHWLKTTYWNRQETRLSVDITNKSSCDKVKLLIKLYCEMNLMQYFDSNLKYVHDIFEAKPSIKDICLRFKKLLRENFEIKHCLNSILPKITKYFSKVDSNHLSNLICDTIITEEALFAFKMIESKGKRDIPDDFVSIWRELLNWLIYNDLLMLFLKKLIHFASNSSNNKRAFGSIWLKVIFTSIYLSRHLSREKLALNLNFKKGVKNLKELEQDILKTPNKETLSFLKIFLELCGHDEEYIDNKLLIVKSYTKIEGGSTKNKIFTLDDFKPIIEKHGMDPTDGIKENNDTKYNEKLNCSGVMEIKPKVRVAPDSSVFVGYPIGILSSQVPF